MKLGVDTDNTERYLGSPVSDGGRGLKQHLTAKVASVFRFARQRWRAWIETSGMWAKRR